MKKLKLFQKTYLFTMALMGVMIIISHTLLYMLLPTFYINKKQQDLSDISTQLIQQLESNNKDMSSKIAKDFSNKYGINIALNIKNKNYVFEGIKQYDIYIKPESLDSESLIINNNVEFKDSENSSESIENKEGYFKVKNSSLFYKKNIKTLDGTSGSVKIVMDLQSFKEARSVVFMLLPYSIGISLIISLFASYIYAKKITTPIKEICNVTKEMEKLNKRAFCNVESEDEIGILAYNINSLYENLLNTIISLEEEIKNVSESEKVKVDFLRSASHELKTPLMSMHIMIENMLYDIGKYKNHYVYLEKCKDIVNELSKMVQEILDTSRLNSIENKNEKLLDLSYIVENALDHYNIIAKSKNINIKVNLNDSFNIKVDEKVFTKAISNIISNAVNYTDEGKEIRVYIKDKKRIIENDCKPISDEHLAHIFEAFYRVDFDRNKSSGGNGLGLYIVEQILRMYNLSFSFKSISTGMRFEIDFN